MRRRKRTGARRKRRVEYVVAGLALFRWALKMFGSYTRDAPVCWR